MNMEKVRRDRKDLDICARSVSDEQPTDDCLPATPSTSHIWNIKCSAAGSNASVPSVKLRMREKSRCYMCRTISCKNELINNCQKRDGEENKKKTRCRSHFRDTTSPEFMSASPVRMLSYRILQLQGRSMQGPAEEETTTWDRIKKFDIATKKVSAVSEVVKFRANKTNYFIIIFGSLNCSFYYRTFLFSFFSFIFLLFFFIMS